jgi:hypothetical protein
MTRTPLLAFLLALALALSGCGGQRPSTGQPPSAATVVAATITSDGVSISPDELGAGPVKLMITNRTAMSQQLAVESSDAGSFHQETAPINPQDMAQLKAELVPGSYRVSVRATGVKSASLAVTGRSLGPSRATPP